MALGNALKQARMRKKLTASEVAAGTRMKVQVVTALEEEDFSVIAAPIYAKGFIRLYADFVGLNERELVQEYVERFVDAKAPAPDQDENVSLSDPELPLSPELPSVHQTTPDEESDDVFDPAPAPPAPAPPTQVWTADDEPDLFSEVEPPSNERRGILMDDGYREVVPPLRERASHATASAVDAFQKAADRVGATCQDACARCLRFVVNRWKGLVRTVVERRRELTQIDFKNLSARHMMALLGVLVLVLLIISSLSRCVRGFGDHAPSGPAPAPLPVAAEPADVYLD